MTKSEKDDFIQIHSLLKKKEYIQVLSRVLNKNTGKIETPYDSDLNHAWYIVGDIYFKLEQYSDAISAFKKSIANWEQDSQAHFALANCYSNINKPNYAKKHLLECIKIEGRDDRLSYNLGNSFFDLEQYDEAIQEYNKVSMEDKEVSTMAARNIELARKNMKK